MKSKFLFTILFFIHFTCIVAQTASTTYPALTKKVKWFFNKSNQSEYYLGGSYSIGLETNNSYIADYKTAYKFNLNVLPAGAILVSCKIAATVTQIDFEKTNAVIKLLDDNAITSDYHDTYDKVVNGSELFSFQYDSVGVYDITSLVSSKLSQGYINIGAEATPHPTLSNAAGLNISLEWKYYPQYNLSAKNDMDGYNGGYIGYGINENPTKLSSPKAFTGYQNDVVNIEAYDDNPTYNNYSWKFNDSEASLNKSAIWKRGGSGDQSLGQTSSASYTIVNNDNNVSLIAYLRKICNVTFQNSFVGGGNGGTILVNSSPQNSPTSQYEVVDQNQVSATAVNQTINGIDYTFTSWSTSSGSQTTTFYPSEHITYSANFIGRPSIANRNQRVTSNNGDYVTIAWDAHPNGNVTQYRVYRKVDSGAEQLLTTTSALSYTDYDYTQTGNASDYRLVYDVRPYYTTEGTESTVYYQSIVFGQLRIDDSSSKKDIALKGVPLEYSINNYPNPFNPTTTINYQLPENGFVTIKVYDMLGKEVATLVNESKSAGYHRVNFDASKLTSGVYVYTITANNFVQSKKMLLMK